MDAIHGITLDMHAEFMNEHGKLQTQYGERDYRPHFEQYLASRGFDWNTWAHAHNAWHERFKADPTGQLEAQFHMKLSQLSAQTHYGDVADMSQDVQGGLTLDKYAQVAAAIAAPGADHAAILAEHGLSMEQWQAGNAAWTDAMSKDTEHKITMQYGQLYAKYSPGHQEAMQAQMAAMLADANSGSDLDEEDEEEEDYTLEKALEELQSKKPRERWTAAHHCAHFYQIGDLDEEPRLKEALNCIPVLMECLERHDDTTISDAESAARDLLDLKQYNDDVQGAISRCLGRGKEKLSELQAAFAPIADKAVPERVHLQSKIQDYTSLVETLEEFLAEWDENAASAAEEAAEEAAEAAAAASPAAQVADVATPSAPSTGGFLDKILSIFR